MPAVPDTHSVLRANQPEKTIRKKTLLVAVTLQAEGMGALRGLWPAQEILWEQQPLPSHLLGHYGLAVRRRRGEWIGAGNPACLSGHFSKRTRERGDHRAELKMVLDFLSLRGCSVSSSSPSSRGCGQQPSPDTKDPGCYRLRGRLQSFALACCPQKTVWIVAVKFSTINI